jgi:hypothetical protein
MSFSTLNVGAKLGQCRKIVRFECVQTFAIDFRDAIATIESIAEIHGDLNETRPMTMTDIRVDVRTSGIRYCPARSKLPMRLSRPSLRVSKIGI